MRRLLLLGGCAALMDGCQTPSRVRRSALLYRDEFRSGLGNWLVEAERPGRVAASDGVLDIDVPAGVTVWFRPQLSGPISIQYDVMAVFAGGPNDHVSDINAFWMATDTRASTGSILEHRRSGAFGDYDQLRTYYAGIGGNRNRTSRFRRYIGSKHDRPLLPQHDLSAREHLIQPNHWYRIELIADGSHIGLRRDGSTMFRLDDPEPYTRGHFGLRTTKSHLRVRDFRVHALAGR